MASSASHQDIVFVCYSRRDSDFAMRLASDLKAAGVNVWIDQLDIAAGAVWDTAVETALGAASTVLVILSPDSAKSDNVRDEIGVALDGKSRIIPIIYKPCKVPLRLSRQQRVDFSGDHRQSMRHLISLLKGDTLSDAVSVKPTGGKMERPLRRRIAIGVGVSTGLVVVGLVAMTPDPPPLGPEISTTEDTDTDSATETSTSDGVTENADTEYNPNPIADECGGRCDNNYSCVKGECEKNPGQQCGDSKECAHDCVDGICKQKPAELWSKCSEEIECEENLSCVEGKCLKNPGQSCESTEECVHSCEEKTCSYKVSFRTCKKLLLTPGYPDRVNAIKKDVISESEKFYLISKGEIKGEKEISIQTTDNRFFSLVNRNKLKGDDRAKKGSRLVLKGSEDDKGKFVLKISTDIKEPLKNNHLVQLKGKDKEKWLVQGKKIEKNVVPIVSYYSENEKGFSCSKFTVIFHDK